MDEHKDEFEWAPAVTKYFFALFSYTKLNCISQNKFLLIFEVKV